MRRNEILRGLPVLFVSLIFSTCLHDLLKKKKEKVKIYLLV